MTDQEIEEGYKKYLEEDKQQIIHSSVFHTYSIDEFKYYISINRELREKYIKNE